MLLSRRLTALAIGVLLAACGAEDASDGVPSLQRPALRVAEGAQEVDVAERVQRLVVPAQIEPWSLRGRATRVVDGAIVAAGLEQEGDDEELFVEIPGEFRSSRCNQIRVHGVFPDTFQVSVQLSGQGERSFRPPTLVTHRSDELQTVAFDLELLLGTARDYDTVLVYVTGSRAGFTLHAVELVDVPLHNFLPAPGEPAEIVDLRGDARAAVGLAPGRVAEARFEVPSSRTRLAFALGLPARLRPRAGKPSVHVALVPETGAARELDLELDISQPGKPQWREESVDLAAYAGQSVTVRFEYRCKALKPGVCALANVHVWHPVPDPPTVLLVSSDTHRADHLNVARSGVAIETPAIDALADGGLFFEACWATTNVTSPSHVAMMTGVHPRDSRLVTNVDRLAPEASTLAEAYRDAGWATIAVVSVGHLGPRGTDLCQGFDRVYSPNTAPWRAGVAVDRILEWIGESHGRPLFVFLHLFDAHHPYAPPASHDRRYWPQDRDPSDPSLPALDMLPGTIPEDLVASGVRDLAFPRAQYKAEVSYLDSELARVFANERVRAGLIALTSDHGEILEKDGTYFNHGALYPDTLRVPLVLGGDALPEDVRGERVAARVEHLDLPRTLLDLANLAHVDFPGRNLLRQVGSSVGEEPPSFALSAHGHSASVTWRGWYLVLHLRDHQGTLARRRAKHEVELFDLRGDPECLVDVEGEQPDTAEELRTALVDWLAQARPGGLSRSRHATAAQVAELAALGYADEAGLSEEEPWYDPESE